MKSAKSSPGPAQLRRLPEGWANPGGLAGFIHVPAGLPDGAPLVVVLHGCTQSAAGFDHGAGWSTLADEAGFAVLYPQQRRGNNANGCFNWFEPNDTARGSGEAASIAAMVAMAIGLHRLDPARVFVTGLSAGGAMAAVMLSAYSDLFAGGAIIAGLPFGIAHDMSGALTAMAQPAKPASKALGNAVRDAAPRPLRWPRVAIWHGAADPIVHIANGTALAGQWADVHGLAAPATERSGPQTIERWRDTAGQVQVEFRIIAGLGHAVPVAPPAGGAAGAYFADIGIPSTRIIAAFFGIASAPSLHAAKRPADSGRSAFAPPPGMTMAARVRSDVAATIDQALRAAGLVGRT